MKTIEDVIAYLELTALSEDICNDDRRDIFRCVTIIKNTRASHVSDTMRRFGKRYRMSYDQPAQIDCRVENCNFYKGAGRCSNVSPAITLNQSGTFVCWSKQLTE